jgi:hypothetical protein
MPTLKTTPTQSSARQSNTPLASRVTTPLEDLLIWAELAPVIPLKRNLKESIGKWTMATRDPQQIEKMYKKYPGCNWGIFGNPALLTVIDIDTKNGRNGLRHAMDWIYEWGDYFDLARIMVETPSGGIHCYHFGLGGSGYTTNNLKIESHTLDIDIRGNENGYAVLPGSVVRNEDGSFGRYSFMGGELTGEDLRQALRSLTAPPLPVQKVAEIKWAGNGGKSSPEAKIQRKGGTNSHSHRCGGEGRGCPEGSLPEPGSRGSSVPALIQAPAKWDIYELAETNTYFYQVWHWGHEVRPGNMSRVEMKIIQVAAFRRLSLPKIQWLVLELYSKFASRGIIYGRKIPARVARTYRKIQATMEPPAPQRVPARVWIENMVRREGKVPTRAELAEKAGIDQNTAKKSLQRYRKAQEAAALKAASRSERTDSTQSSLAPATHNQIEQAPAPPSAGRVNENEAKIEELPTEIITKSFPFLCEYMNNLDMTHKPTLAQLDVMMTNSGYRHVANGDWHATEQLRIYVNYLTGEGQRDEFPGYKWFRKKLIDRSCRDIIRYVPEGDRQPSTAPVAIIDPEDPDPPARQKPTAKIEIPGCCDSSLSWHLRPPRAAKKPGMPWARRVGARSSPYCLARWASNAHFAKVPRWLKPASPDREPGDRDQRRSSRGGLFGRRRHRPKKRPRRLRISAQRKAQPKLLTMGQSAVEAPESQVPSGEWGAKSGYLLAPSGAGESGRNWQLDGQRDEVGARTLSFESFLLGTQTATFL